MTESPIRYETTNRVGIVTVDRPPVNALRYEDLEKLAARFENLPEEDELAIVLAGAGDRAFVAGHDVNEFSSAGRDAHAAGTETYERLAEAIFGCPLPTLAAVDGPALGTGMVLACLCDVRVVAPDATFGLPEIDVGVVAGFETARRVLPDGIARDLVFTGRSLSGRRAFELGLASHLAETPQADAVEVATSVASKSPEAVRAAKKLMLERGSDRPVDGLRRERETSEELLQGTNAAEAVRSFIEGREPSFEG